MTGEFLPVDLTGVDLSEAPVYQKCVTVQARPSVFGEHLETILADGTVETVRELGIGQMVVTNPGGEQYAVPVDTFHERYMWNGTAYQSTGRIRAVRNPWCRPIVVDAPWGELQFGGEDCWVAATLDGGDMSPDRYLIGAGEFADTYREDCSDGV